MIAIAVIYALTVLASLALIGYVALAFADRYDRAGAKALGARCDELQQAILNVEAQRTALEQRVDKLYEARNLRAASGATGGRSV